MTITTHRYRIVVALDDSEYSEIVLEHAVDQAVRHDAVDLHFLTVVSDDRDVDAAGKRLSQQLLEGFNNVRDTPGDRRIRLHVRVGDAVDEVIQLAAELQADLLVIGRFGTHVRDRTLATALVERAPCPALVVGLTEHAVEATKQCEACVAVREATDGETWFCEAHTSDTDLHMSSLLPWTGATNGHVW